MTGREMIALCDQMFDQDETDRRAGAALRQLIAEMANFDSHCELRISDIPGADICIRRPHSVGGSYYPHKTVRSGSLADDLEHLVEAVKKL